MSKKFAVLIVTHGRSNRVITVKTLRDSGYTGDIYLVVDNEDDELEDYKKIYGDKVIVFDKKKKFDEVDTGDNLQARNVVLFARNSCFEIAKSLGLDYFLELDDDYDDFSFRYVDYENHNKFRRIKMRQFDKVVDTILDFLDVSGALTVTLAQCGDYIGGIGSKVWQDQLARKAMNSFFCRVDRPFDFVGRINEDVNTYVTLSNKGHLFFTIAQACLNQLQTQSNENGMTTIYLQYGTFTKSFYSVIYAPSCAKVGMMGSTHKRIHHIISSNNCYPKILSEKWKKMQ